MVMAWNWQKILPNVQNEGGRGGHIVKKMKNWFWGIPYNNDYDDDAYNNNDYDDDDDYNNNDDDDDDYNSNDDDDDPD